VLRHAVEGLGRQILDDDAAVIHLITQNISVPIDYDPFVEISMRQRKVCPGNLVGLNLEHFVTCVRPPD